MSSENLVELTFEVELNYGDVDPEDMAGVATPDVDDIGRYIKEGMERDGFTSADIRVIGQ
jgi:hypothetical protein